MPFGAHRACGGRRYEAETLAVFQAITLRFGELLGHWPAMVEAAQRCVVVADGSKIGNISVVKIADLDAVDLVVTGASAPVEALGELRRRGTAVEVAS